MTNSEREDFRTLMARVRMSSEGAVQSLVEEYGDVILRVVRRKLNKQLRPKFDSVDFVQAVWASFFAMSPDRLAFDRPDQLAAFLVRLAGNKVIESIRQRMSGFKYNVNRERSLHKSDERAAPQIEARGPSAEQIAIAREEWHRLVKDQTTRDQDILESLRDGRSAREVAEELGLSEKTIRRLIRKLRSGDS